MDQAASNPGVAEKAGTLKDALDNPDHQALWPTILDELDTLSQQHPWIPDFLANRTVPPKGGTRRP